MTDEQVDLAGLISEDFYQGRLDLSARAGAPKPGFDALPECVAIRRIRAAGAADSDVRVFITLMAAMDRARDATALWLNGAILFESKRWPFIPSEVIGRSLSDLWETLMPARVSQRHTTDVATWRLIAEALLDQTSPQAVRSAIFEGTGRAQELLSAVRQFSPQRRPWYPLLSGPKVSVMWIRMLAAPGDGQIADLDVLPVAVDVQVRKVTEYLGVTDTGTKDLEAVRQPIQDAWRALSSRTSAPGQLDGSGAGLDPALWFYARWGCTACERVSTRLPIGRACSFCRFPLKSGQPLTSA